MKLAPSSPEEHKRTPAFIAPPGSCDSHCHVFGPAAVFPYAPDRSYTPTDAPKEALAALHADLGIDRAVIVQASCHGTDNRAMMDAIASRPDQYRGVAIIDDSFGDKELQQLHDGGVRGVRFNFVRHLGGAPDKHIFDRVIDRVSGRGWHVVLHLDASDIVPLSQMIANLPLPFIIDHMGRIDTSLGIEQPAFQSLIQLCRNDSCWVKVCGAERISAYPFTAALPFAKALVAACPERTLWGTDFPHPNLKQPVNEADLLDLVQEFALTTQEQQRLLVDNPARLYDFAT